MDATHRNLDTSSDVETPTTSTQTSVDSLQHEQENKGKYYSIYGLVLTKNENLKL